MTVADPAGDAPAAGGRDGPPRRGFRRLAEQGPGLLEGPVPSQSPCLQPLTPVRAHLRQAMTSSSYAGNPRFGSLKVFTIWSDRWPGNISPNFPCLRQGFDPPLSRRTASRHTAQADRTVSLLLAPCFC